VKGQGHWDENISHFQCIAYRVFFDLVQKKQNGAGIICGRLTTVSIGRCPPMSTALPSSNWTCEI